MFRMLGKNCCPMSKRVNFLYTNTPNQILLERLRAFNNHGFFCYLIYGIRKGYHYTLKFSHEDFTHASVKLVDSRGLSFVKLWNAWLMYKSSFRCKGSFYAIYPDMLLVAVFIKLTKLGRASILYEIQDLHSSNRVYRFLHCLLMLFADKIFITSEGFKNEFSFFKRTLLRKSLYISNAPDYQTIKSLKKVEKKKLSSFKKECFQLGFVGNLRDHFQLACIEYFLRNTSLKILQAGATEFSSELDALEQEYQGRFFVYGKYDDKSLGEIWDCIDTVWAVYPDTYNYRHHIARRLHEAAFRNKKIILGAHAKYNISLSEKFDMETLVLDIQEIKKCADEVSEFCASKSNVKVVGTPYEIYAKLQCETLEYEQNK